MIHASKRAVLIGHPLGHSLSPAFQNAAFHAAGIDAEYSLADVLPEHLAATIASLRADEMLGANVTVPYKQAVIPFLDSLSDDARALGAVNTIVNRAGHLYGLNTDVPGFAADLREHGVTVAGTSVVMLGAGGAARGVAAALVSMAVARLTIANRTVERAEAVASQYPHLVFATNIDSVEMPGALSEASLIINATSVGLHGDDLPVVAGTLMHLPTDAVVYDLIYRPTAFLRAAEARGLRAIDGLGMLVHQGALAWEQWTGQPAPLGVMWDAARAGRTLPSGGGGL